MASYNTNSAISMSEDRKAHLVKQAVSILEGNAGSPVQVIGTTSCTITSDVATISVAMRNLFLRGKLLEGTAVLHARREGLFFPDWRLDKVYLDLASAHRKAEKAMCVWSAGKGNETNN